MPTHESKIIPSVLEQQRKILARQDEELRTLRHQKSPIIPKNTHLSSSLPDLPLGDSNNKVDDFLSGARGLRRPRREYPELPTAFETEDFLTGGDIARERERAAHRQKDFSSILEFGAKSQFEERNEPLSWKDAVLHRNDTSLKTDSRMLYFPSTNTNNTRMDRVYTHAQTMPQFSINKNSHLNSLSRSSSADDMFPVHSIPQRTTRRNGNGNGNESGSSSADLRFRPRGDNRISSATSTSSSFDISGVERLNEVRLRRLREMEESPAKPQEFLLTEFLKG
ncbi:hypothetical protein HDU76_009059 [Blyttiomyces sp. JEL0837]|nr:hypothetical protein HDU76_009059 [Blyttiomyces sp. JEL0837]